MRVSRVAADQVSLWVETLAAAAGSQLTAVDSAVEVVEVSGVEVVDLAVMAADLEAMAGALTVAAGVDRCQLTFGIRRSSLEEKQGCIW